MSVLPERVERAIDAAFSSDAAIVRDTLLSETGLVGDAPYERFLLAVIDLASPDVAKVQHYADAARRDWRDVLH